MPALNDEFEVTFSLTGVLRDACGGRAEFKAMEHTIYDALLSLFNVFPTVRRFIVDESGGRTGYVQIFVDGNRVSREAFLDQPLDKAVLVTMLPSLSGG